MFTVLSCDSNDLYNARMVLSIILNVFLLLETLEFLFIENIGEPPEGPAFMALKPYRVILNYNHIFSQY